MRVFQKSKIWCVEQYYHFCTILFRCRVFGKFGYGFGLPKNSPFTHQFSVKILELRQNGFVKLLTERWFHGVCEKISQESGGTEVLNKTEITENSFYIKKTNLIITTSPLPFIACSLPFSFFSLSFVALHRHFYSSMPPGTHSR